MANDTVAGETTSQQQHTMSEKNSEQHIEDLKSYGSDVADTPVPSGTPPDWEEEEPRLNTQMVLAFIVCHHILALLLAPHFSLTIHCRL